MEASFDNKLNQLEAQFRTAIERIPNSTASLSGPRRPRPFDGMCFPPSSLSSSSSPSSNLPSSAHQTPVTPGGVLPRRSPMSLSTPSPASLLTPSPSYRVMGVGNDIFPLPSRVTPDESTSTPSPVGGITGCESWRPGSSELRRPSGGSSLSSPGGSGIEFSLPRQGSSSSLGGGLPLNGTPRQRQTFNLPCSPQTPKSIDSFEIDQKYKEIMKQNGILTINDQRIATDISELEPAGELGHGTCGHVIKMRYVKTDHVMAVKQMRRSGSCEDNKRIIMDLDVVIKSHNCPYIVQCIGTFILTEEVWICMELMATCLDKLTKRLQEPVPERILGKVAVATVNALHYLKEKHGVIHRDVKPSNILLDERGRIKLCDFGISGRLVDSKAKTRGAGCAAYLAPERIDPPDPFRPDYDIRADVWSLGLSLVELATGEFPYKNCKTDFEMLAKIMDEDPPLLPSGCGFSINFRSFVSRCLAKDYLQRPKYQQLLEHNFITHYTSQNVDVASWYSEVKQLIDSKSAINANVTSS